MQCSNWDEWMSLHLDGLLSPAQELQLQAHLADCPACREQWAVLSWLSVRLKADPLAVPAPDFTARVTARLEQREARRRRLYSSIGICVVSVGLWTVAALVVFALFGILVDPSLRAILWNVALSLGQSALAFLTAVGEALWTIVRVVATRPAGLLLLGYGVLAVALAGFWTRLLFRLRESVVE